MIKNYVSVAWRAIRQNPLYAFINIFSLAIALATCMIIYLFIKDERSFDAFHSRKENIYRLNEVQNFTGTGTHKVPLSMPAMGPYMLKEFPEVVNYTRFYDNGKRLIVRGEKQFLVPRLAFTDSTFLEIFDFEALKGNRNTALDKPRTIVVTEATALKFFNTVDEAMGNSLNYNGIEYTITAILNNLPENSHLQFDALISMTGRFHDVWSHSFLNTYLVLHPDTKVKALEEKFPAFMRRHVNDPDINNRIVLYLQRLDQVHLGSVDVEQDGNNHRKFNSAYLDMFSVVGVFILLIAAVNFMNITTARASHRWKEIGVRKTIGAKKIQLFAQFILESTMLSFFALLMAALMNLLFIPLINDLIDRKLSFASLVNEPVSIFYLLSGTVSLGLLTGIYPSVYMASVNTAGALKGGRKGDTRSFFRSGLVIVQFGLALGMIVSTLIVVQQLSYMKNKDLGFNEEQMMLIDMNAEASDKFEILRTELKRSLLVYGVTASVGRLGEIGNQSAFKVKSDGELLSTNPSKIYVDHEYLTVYGIQIKEGRNFSNEFTADRGKVFIINESFAKELGVKETVGTFAGHAWHDNDSLGTIIGVVKDFNFKSLHHKISPLVMGWPDFGYTEMSVKIDGTRAEEAIAFVKATWEKHIDYPFAYNFLDQHFETLYRSDKQLGGVLTMMAGLAILISSMGLFALAAIITERKTKEIGIRKVLGATEAQITVLLSKNITLLIVLSFVLASPVTYWLLSQWLANFAYRVAIDPLLFLMGGFIGLTIALGTISHHTIRSARANPVKALRHE